jgi:hypothetical protein
MNCKRTFATRRTKGFAQLALIYAGAMANFATSSVYY